MSEPSIPVLVTELIDQVRALQGPKDSIEAVTQRASNQRGPVAAALIGAGVDPATRTVFDKGLDDAWLEQRNNLPKQDQVVGEVVIGAGLTAAIYSAMRRRMGFPAPVVLDASSRVGGSFACSRGPSFYLNSRNRPGPLSVPGEREALNVLPGALVQPADLSPAEYQRNNDLAFAIRTTLAINADVFTDAEVLGIEALTTRNGGTDYELLLGGGLTLRASRVLEATGLGRPVPPAFANDLVMTFPDFMARFDEPFPLLGLRKVAVVGGGDSGRCAIESLVGQGPSEHWSVPSLDYPEQIDWYGVPNAGTGERFAECNRSRYRGIARFLPRVEGDSVARVQPVPEFAEVTVGVDCAYVNGRPYDAVVWCTGFRKEFVSTSFQREGDVISVGGRNVAVSDDVSNYFRIGPAADLEMTEEESDRFGQIPENGTALFRYAAKTAALATYLSDTNGQRRIGIGASAGNQLSVTVDLTQLASASDDTPVLNPVRNFGTPVDLDQLTDIPDETGLEFVNTSPQPEPEPEPQTIDLSELALRSDDEPL